MDKKQKLLNDGYIIGKEIISAKTISFLEKHAKLHKNHSGIHKHSGVRQPHAFRKAPFTIEIFNEKKLINLISEIFATSDWYITNHADLHSNALSGWHKDDGMTYGNGGYFGEELYYLENPNVFKVAVYFQDHRDFEDGLTIVPGSHRESAVHDSTQRDLHIETNVGDVLIFDPRLSHTGQLAPIPKPITSFGEKIIGSIEDKVKTIEAKSLPQEEKNKQILEIFRNKVGQRSSLFFTVAIDSDPSNIFSIKNMTRQLDELGPDVSPYLPPYISNKLSEFGVKSIDDKEFWRSAFPI